MSILLLAVATVAAWTESAGAAPGDAGTLTCTELAEALDDERLSCTFKPSSAEAVEEYYAGRISRAAHSASQKITVIWSVWSRTGKVAPGGLEGTFKAAPLGKEPLKAGVLTGRDIRLEPLPAGFEPAIDEITLERNRPRV